MSVLWKWCVVLVWSPKYGEDNLGIYSPNFEKNSNGSFEKASNVKQKDVEIDNVKYTL